MNKELLSRIRDMLSKYSTLSNLICDVTDDDEIVIQFTISDAHQLYSIMTAFFSGSTKWECEFAGWSDKSIFVSFHTSIKGMKDDDIQRELDYKSVLLKF